MSKKYWHVRHSSNQNITVESDDYVMVDPTQMESDGTVSEATREKQWQEFVNEYMADTCVEVVNEEDVPEDFR